jgi:hypothetical protein
LPEEEKAHIGLTIGLRSCDAELTDEQQKALFDLMVPKMQLIEAVVKGD